MVRVDSRIGEKMKNFSPTCHSQNTCLSRTAPWLSISSLPITLSQEESGLQSSSHGPVRPESDLCNQAELGMHAGLAIWTSHWSIPKHHLPQVLYLKPELHVLCCKRWINDNYYFFLIDWWHKGRNGGRCSFLCFSFIKREKRAKKLVENEEKVKSWS